MSTKRCPFCAEEIQADAIKCRFCLSLLNEGGNAESHQSAGNSNGLNYQANRKFVRSQSDRMMSGVCGGLAEYLNLDALLVRILVVAATFGTGIFPGLIGYVVVAITAPESETSV